MIKFKIEDKWLGATSCGWTRTITARSDVADNERLASILAHEFAHQLNLDLSYQQALVEKSGIPQNPDGTYTLPTSAPDPTLVLRTFVTEWRAWRYAVSLFPDAIYKYPMKQYMAWVNNQLDTSFVCPFKMTPIPEHRRVKYMCFIASHQEELIDSPIGEKYPEAVRILLDKVGRA